MPTFGFLLQPPLWENSRFLHWNRLLLINYSAETAYGTMKIKVKSQLKLTIINTSCLDVQNAKDTNESCKAQVKLNKPLELLKGRSQTERTNKRSPTYPHTNSIIQKVLLLQQNNFFIVLPHTTFHHFLNSHLGFTSTFCLKWKGRGKHLQKNWIIWS